jgi:glutathione S-transferase
VILFSSPLSPYSARVKISLRYKDIGFEPVKPSSLGGMTSPRFLAVAPLGRIPTRSWSIWKTAFPNRPCGRQH